MTRAIMNMLRVNIQASIDNEIIKTLMAMGAGEIDIPVDLTPFNIKFNSPEISFIFHF
jgi:hypothetical protein